MYVLPLALPLLGLVRQIDTRHESYPGIGLPGQEPLISLENRPFMNPSQRITQDRQPLDRESTWWREDRIVSPAKPVYIVSCASVSEESSDLLRVVTPAVSSHSCEIGQWLCGRTYLENNEEVT